MLSSTEYDGLLEATESSGLKFNPDTEWCAAGRRSRMLPSNSTFRTAVTGIPLGRGILPDYPVGPTIDDIAAGRDPVMETALGLAASAAE